MPERSGFLVFLDKKWINFEAVVGIFKEEFKTNQTVHGILLDFEKKGYSTITSNDKNKRERLVAFIEKGKLFAASVLEKLYEMEEDALSCIVTDSFSKRLTIS